MRNLRVQQCPHIEVAFGPDDWGLYDDRDAKFSATALNARLSLAVNELKYDKDATRRYVLDAMAKWSFIGALDTEPRAHLERALTEIFGE